MPNSQIYSVFLIKTNSTEGAVFLFQFKQDPLLRPGVGDVLTDPSTFGQFKIIRDQLGLDEERVIRFTDDFSRRITNEGNIRITHGIRGSPDLDTHRYYVTPANNPNRITSYSTIPFDNDQTLKQLFK